MSDLADFRISPRLHLRAPATGGIVADLGWLDQFRTSLLGATEVHGPSVVVINLEGRFLTVPALYQLIIPLGQAVQSRTHGDITLIFATPDPSTRDGIRALAEAYQLPMYVAAGVNEIADAQPVGPLTPGEHDTIDLIRRLGGRVTVAQLADISGLEQPAAANRLNAVAGKHLVYRVDRPRSEGHLYVAPWLAQPEDPADPTSADFRVPEEMRADVRALAEAQGRAPEEVFSEALQAFLSKHRALLGEEQKKVAEMMKSGDEQGLRKYAKQYSKKQAAESARRAKRR